MSLSAKSLTLSTSVNFFANYSKYSFSDILHILKNCSDLFMLLTPLKNQSTTSMTSSNFLHQISLLCLNLVWKKFKWKTFHNVVLIFSSPISMYNLWPYLKSHEHRFLEIKNMYVKNIIFCLCEGMCTWVQLISESSRSCWIL